MENKSKSSVSLRRFQSVGDNVKRDNSTLSARFGDNANKDNSTLGASSSRTTRRSPPSTDSVNKITNGGTIKSRAFRRLNINDNSREPSIKSQASSQATRLSTLASERSLSTTGKALSNISSFHSPTPQPSDNNPSAPNTTAQDKSDSFIFIGIDFGTTFSGVAWAWSGASQDIKVVTNWNAYEYLNGDKDKAPSEIFYNTLTPNLSSSTSQTTPDATWGYGIETGSEPLKWFKLLLLDDEDMDERIRHSCQIEKARKLLQASGKSAVEVIADYLHFLWKHALENIEQDMGVEAVDGTPFRVVITVPAVWNHKAIARMKKAALKSGMLDNRLCGETILHFVSEPEAAALATFHDMRSRPDFKVGDSIVVCDAGGGTVDLISYKVYKENPLELRECVEGQGGLCGAVFLDEDFEILLKQALGNEVWNKIEPSSLRRIMNNDWENGIKRGFNGRPRSWLVTLPYECNAGPSINFEHGMIKEMFDNVIHQIRGLINDQIRKVEEKEGKAPTAIVLVGGFSSCQYLYQTLKLEHQDNIGIFKSAGTKPWSAICRGAVLKALTNSDLAGVKVSSRISRRNYGTVFRTVFIEGEHMEEDKIFDPMVGRHKASNQIEWHLSRGADIWDHETDLVGRHRNVSSTGVDPSGMYFWKESIYACDLPNPPKRKTTETQKLGDIRAEVNINGLPEKRNAEGKLYRSLKFKIEMNICGSELEFAIVFDGKRIAQKNIEVDFERSTTPVGESVSSGSVSSLGSAMSHSPSLIKPPKLLNNLISSNSRSSTPLATTNSLMPFR